MEKETKVKVKLGVIVVTGLALFVAAIFMIGARQYLLTRTITVSTTFSDLSGLQPGDNVRYAGVPIGIVDKITFLNGTTIKVDMKIDADMAGHIHKDAEALILSEGLIGSKILSIQPGTTYTELIQDKDVISSRDPLNASEIMEDLVASNENLALLTEQLAEMSTKLNTEGGLFSELVTDTVMAEKVSLTITKLNENLDAMRSNILLKGYFNKKEKREEREEKRNNRHKDRDDSAETKEK